MKPHLPVLLAAFLAWPVILAAQVPNLINYQGRVAVGSVNFEGTGQFKFALVNADGSTTYWSNDGTSTEGSQPTAAVSLTVTKGLYAVLLGDSSLPNMTAIPASVWSHPDVRLRVWFNDGTNGSQLLTPDQRLAPNGYLPDGAVSSAKLTDGSVNAAKLANGAVGSVQLAAGAVTSSAIAPGTVLPTQAVSGATQAVANTSYAATGSAAPDTFTLPATANVGDTIQITGTGTAGWNTTGAWTARESSRYWRSVASSADGSKLVAVADDGQIYTSTDSGVSWTARESSRDWQSVASSADGSKLVAVVQFGQIYTSTDSGVSWTARESNRLWFSVASSADGSKLVAVELGGQIYTSADSGQNWTPRESNRPWRSVASSADGSKLVAVVNGGQIYTSTDSGANWTARESSRDWYSVASSADGGKLVAVVGRGQIYTSTDSGANWTARESNRLWFFVASSADGSKLVAVELYGQIYTSADSGQNWTPRESDRNWQSVASSADGGRLVAVVHFGQIYTSLSGVQGSSVALQYVGDGQWTARQETQIATGAVGSTQIATGAVGSTQIATGAVGNPQLASGLDVSKLGGGTVDNTELGYLDGVTSGIQGQFGTLTTNLDNLTTTVNGKVSKAGDTMSGPLTLQTTTGDSSATARISLIANGAHEWRLQSVTGFSPPPGSPTASFQLINTTSAVTALTALQDGKVGLGRIPSANRLEVEGNASKTTAGDWLANSDRRIKEDIQPVTDALDTLSKVRLVDFRYTPDYRTAHPGIEDRRYLNVVAQEFAEVFPGHVKSSGETLPDGSPILQVDTYPLTIYSAAAVQELNEKLGSEVEKLRKENAALKTRLEEADAAVQKRLADLEAALAERIGRLEGKAAPPGNPSPGRPDESNPAPEN